MKFFRNIFSKDTYICLNLSKEIVVAIILITLPIFYPTAAQAGIFSFIYDFAGDKASAKVVDNQDAPNPQNMKILKAVVNPDLNQKSSAPHQILASGDALVAEIGPAGTIFDINTNLNTEISLYVVRDGDTLSEIASMFDVSVNTILWANDLEKNSVLREGQTLVILPITGIQHLVKKGDTIKTIVKYYKADLNEVLRYNGLSSNSPLAEGSTIIIPEAEPTANQSSSSSGRNSRSSFSKLPSYSGYYMRPIVGGRKSQRLHGHNAVDLAAPIGTPIYSAAGGVVIISKMNGGWHGGYGNYVVISHPNGTQTLYSHNMVNFVFVGDTVGKGDMIAKIGVTGNTTGPHVHFEIRGAANPF